MGKPKGTAITAGPNAVFWDGDRPYWKTTTGGKSYIPPITAGQYHDDPKMMAFAAANGVTAANPVGDYGGKHASYLHNRPSWDADRGSYEQGINWNNILSTAVGAGLGVGGWAAFTAPTMAPATAAATTAATSAAPAAAVAPAAAAATAAPAAAAATGGGMNATNWLNLIMFGGKTATDIYGARTQANASDRASEADLQYSREALAFLQKQWEQQRTDFQPWLNAGSNAMNTINRNLSTASVPGMPATVAARLGVPPGSNAIAPTMPLGRAPVAPQPGQGQGGWQTFNGAPTVPAPVAAPAQMVTVVAPDGSSRRQVPAWQVPHWKELGAQVEA